MYAIVEIKGQQFKVQENQEIFVHRMEQAAGEEVTFETVLLTEKDGKVEIGAPTLNTSVKATVLDHLQGDKVVIFKKKRRKGYRKKNGHRQALTKIRIDAIA